MGLFALTAEAVQGLNREEWGRKVPDYSNVIEALASLLVQKGLLNQGEFTAPPPDMIDTAVDPPIRELTARLGSQAPIKMAGTLDLIQPANAPAIRIYTRNNGHDAIVFQESVNAVGSDGSHPIQVSPDNGGSNSALVPGDDSIGAQQAGGGGLETGGGTGGGATSGVGGATRDIEVVTGVSVSASASGCSITLSATVTYATITVPA